MVYTPTNWGLPFLLIVGLGGAVYFGGGYLHGKRTRGARGVQALPHAQHWLALHGLVSDGVAHPAEKKLCREYRAHHNLSRRQHVQILRGLGWTAEEWEDGGKHDTLPEKAPEKAEVADRR